MRCPSLKALPAPPIGRTGWPWTIETPALPDTRRDGSAWPRISIVVASLNHGQYVEHMLRSVLLQGYPDLELIVIDGGSDRQTLEAIERYRSWFSYWVSEPDAGQSDAINKGMARVTGSLFNHFDTDDYFLAGALGAVAEAHMREPGQIIAGDVVRTIEGSDVSEVHRPQPHDLRAYVQWWQTEHHGGPGMFFPSQHLAAVGAVDTSLHFLMDYEFTLRFLAVTAITAPGVQVAVIRHHAGCKSVKDGDEFVWECVHIVRRYRRQFPELTAAADREGAGALFGFGFRRWLFRQGGGWRYMREGWRTHPFWAVYWLIPGWFLRRWTRLRSRS